MLVSEFFQLRTEMAEEKIANQSENFFTESVLKEIIEVQINIRTCE